MNIIKPIVELITITPNAERLIEQAGRTCYKSEEKTTDESAKAFIKMIIRRGHLSVLEHASATIRFVTDRGVTHEMVRHRLAAFSQESTRYCNYGADRFGAEISVIEPPMTANQRHVWLDAMCRAEEFYLEMLEEGASPQIARSVLPNALKTEIVMTCNFREWLHVFKLRTAPAAHPQIREVMCHAHDMLTYACPAVFSTTDQ